MFSSFKKLFKWGSNKNLENKNKQSFHIAALFRGVLEDVLFWENVWLSLSFILFINAIFFACYYKEINFSEIVLYLYICFLSVDAFEAWLVYKHRTSCLKRLADHDGEKLIKISMEIRKWIAKKWKDFMYLRGNNHTKAFLLIELLLGVLFLIGKYVNGYFFLYSVLMSICVLKKVAPPLLTLLNKMEQNAESDVELEGLIPEVSDVDINLLSIEPEPNQIYDERQTFDYWKPDDLPQEEASDSSDNSSSIITNLSMDKMHTMDKGVDSSDSSDNEYIPIDQQKEHLQTTMEIVQPSSSWSSSAYNALWNISGTIANMVYSKPDVKRKRISSVGSSDGFEIVEKQDLI